MPVSLVDPYASGIRWDELVDSDSGEVNYNSPSSQRKWLVTGTYDPNDLINSAKDNIPVTNVRGSVIHLFKSYKWGPTSPTLGNTWLVTADYAFQVDYFELSFDTSGGTAKREQAFDVGTYYACQSPGGQVTPGASLAANAPAYDGGTTYALGALVVSGGVTYSSKANANTGNAPPNDVWWAVATPTTVPNFKGVVIDGVEVPDDKFDFTALVRNKYSTLPASYIDLLSDLTGHTNDRPLSIAYKGQALHFGQEELLYQGSPGKITSEDGYEFTLKFSKQKSVGVGSGNGGGVGLSAGSIVVANFTQPANQGNVAVTLLDIPGGLAISPGNIIYIKDSAGKGGRYVIVSFVGSAVTVMNLGDPTNAAPGTVINAGAWFAFETDPLTIGNSGPIQKLGWRFLKTINKEVIVGGQRTAQPQYVIVNKVIRTADLGQLGIFS